MARSMRKQQKPRVIVKRKGGFLGKLVAFLLGMVFGVVAFFGGIGVVVYGVLNKPVDETYNSIEQAGFDIPGELSDYLSADFATLTLGQAFATIGQTAGGLVSGGSTLADLVAISPILGEQIGGWSDSLSEFGVPATKEELLSLNFANVPQYLTSKLNSISIASLVSSFTGGISPDNGVLCALLYGKKDVHYTVNGDNQVELLPLTYAFHSTTSLNETFFTDWDNNKYVYSTERSGWMLEENATTYIAAYVSTSADGQISYKYQIRDFSDTPLYNLAQLENTDNYVVYENDTVKKHTGLTIGSIMEGDGIMGVVNQMELFTLMNMNEETDAMILALAGYEKDEDGNLKLQEGKQPTTIGSLMTDATGILTGMKIANLIPIEDDNTLMMALAYKDGDKSQPRTIADLMESGTDLINELYIADLLGIDGTSNALMLSLAYEEGYIINSDNSITGTKKPISNLTSGNLMDELYVADILAIDGTSNALMLSLAYEEGYIINPDNSITGTKKSINSLTSGNLMDELYVADILAIDGTSNKLMLSLAYEEGYIINPDNSITGTKKKVSSLTSGDLMDNLYVADVLSVDGTSNKLMLSLAYEEGYVINPDNSITGTKKSINSLTSGNLVDELYLADVLGIDGTSSPLMISLSYEEGYIINVDNSITGTKKKISSLTQGDITEDLYLADVLGIDGTSNKLMLSLAYEEGYTINSDNSIDGTKKKISSLMEGNLTDNLYVADVLGIDGTSSKLMLSLAYEEGYTINSDNSIDGTKKKLSSLTSGDLTDSLYVADVLGIDGTSNKLMLSLAYEEGYIINDDDSITGTKKKLSSLTSGDLTDSLYVA
ncbi:MAG: hypothetical protein IKA72_02385, partial [Clostridia bacterium]|nr:hypothetical protein [Clostridia bacterium]